MARSHSFSQFRAPSLVGLAVVGGACLLGRAFWPQSPTPKRLVTAPFTRQGVALAQPANNRPAPQYLWSLPLDASFDVTFDAILERPDGRINLYWYGWSFLSQQWYHYVTSFDKAGRNHGTKVRPGDGQDAYYLLEAWDKRGQHAYTASYQRDSIHLRSNGYASALRHLPYFKPEEIKSLRFSPDGECLYVLTSQKLWIVGAQSGRLLRGVSPRRGQKTLTSWGDEYEPVALSPDCRHVLAMRDQLTLFSTRTGQVVRRFANSLHTEQIGEGYLDTRFDFADAGELAVASRDKSGGGGRETWVYSVKSGALRWHGTTPYTQVNTPNSFFFVDIRQPRGSRKPILALRRWRDGKEVYPLNIGTDNELYDIRPPLLFTRDERWIYYLYKNSLYRTALLKG